MAAGYCPRIADAELRACLASAGAVVIEGPKACGKTRMAQQLAASAVLLDVDPSARQALAVDPALVLAGARPRLLDEWQVEPALWNQMRRAVDACGEPGPWCAAADTATDAPMASAWCRWDRWNPEPPIVQIDPAPPQGTSPAQCRKVSRLRASISSTAAKPSMAKRPLTRSA